RRLAAQRVLRLPQQRRIQRGGLGLVAVPPLPPGFVAMTFPSADAQAFIDARTFLGGLRRAGSLSLPALAVVADLVEGAAEALDMLRLRRRAHVARGLAAFAAACGLGSRGRAAAAFDRHRVLQFTSG